VTSIERCHQPFLSAARSQRVSSQRQQLGSAQRRQGRRQVEKWIHVSEKEGGKRQSNARLGSFCLINTGTSLPTKSITDSTTEGSPSTEANPPSRAPPALGGSAARTGSKPRPRKLTRWTQSAWRTAWETRTWTSSRGMRTNKEPFMHGVQTGLA